MIVRSCCSFRSWSSFSYGETLLLELFTEVAIPVVFDFIIRATGEAAGDERPTVAEEAVEADDEVFFFRTDVPPLDIGAEIVHPSKSATLPAAKQTCVHQFFAVVKIFTQIIIDTESMGFNYD